MATIAWLRTPRTSSNAPCDCSITALVVTVECLRAELTSRPLACEAGSECERVRARVCVRIPACVRAFAPSFIWVRQRVVVIVARRGRLTVIVGGGDVDRSDRVPSRLRLTGHPAAERTIGGERERRLGERVSGWVGGQVPSRRALSASHKRCTITLVDRTGHSGVRDGSL